AEFALPPSKVALTPGDVIAIEVRGRERLVEINETVDASAIAVKARGIDPDVFEAAVRPPRPASVEVPAAAGPPLVHVLDLPVLGEGAEPPLQYLAVHAAPWPGAMSVWCASGESFERVALATTPALVGE